MVGVVLRGGGSGRVQMDEDVVSNWRGGSVLLIGGVSSEIVWPSIMLFAARLQ